MDSDHFETTDVNRCASAYTHENPPNLSSGFFRPQKCYLGGGVLVQSMLLNWHNFRWRESFQGLARPSVLWYEFWQNVSFGCYDPPNNVKFSSYNSVGSEQWHDINNVKTWGSTYLSDDLTGLDLYEARDDGVLGCWTICKQSAPRSRQITTPIPHHFGMMEKYICAS